MTQYKVLGHFQWGQLNLEEGQIINIKTLDDGSHIVSVNHYPDKSQRIGPGSLDNFINILKKIKKY